MIGEILENCGYYYFSGMLKKSSAKKIVTWILENNLARPKTLEYMVLVITSDGGDVTSAFAVIDAIRSSKIPVYTIGTGSVGSAALFVFMAGEKGHRTLTPNTSILSHQWSWENTGKQHELMATVREYELTQKRLMDHYKQCSNLNEEEIKKILLPPQDVWLGAEECKTYGLCDVVEYGLK